MKTLHADSEKFQLMMSMLLENVKTGAEVVCPNCFYSSLIFNIFALAASDSNMDPDVLKNTVGVVNNTILNDEKFEQLQILTSFSPESMN